MTTGGCVHPGPGAGAGDISHGAPGDGDVSEGDPDVDEPGEPDVDPIPHDEELGPDDIPHGEPDPDGAFGADEVVAGAI